MAASRAGSSSESREGEESDIFSSNQVSEKADRECQCGFKSSIRSAPVGQPKDIGVIDLFAAR